MNFLAFFLCISIQIDGFMSISLFIAFTSSPLSDSRGCEIAITRIVSTFICFTTIQLLFNDAPVQITGKVKMFHWFQCLNLCRNENCSQNLTQMNINQIYIHCLIEFQWSIQRIIIKTAIRSRFSGRTANHANIILRKSWPSTWLNTLKSLVYLHILLNIFNFNNASIKLKSFPTRLQAWLQVNGNVFQTKIALFFDWVVHLIPSELNSCWCEASQWTMKFYRCLKALGQSISTFKMQCMNCRHL